LYRVSGLATISNNITIQGDGVFNGSVTATGYASTSDSRIKENIEDVSTDDAMDVLKAISAKTYKRTDTGSESRIGFIADDWVQNTPPEWSNIWSVDYTTGMFQLDYARISAVLWTCCQEQQKAIEALTTRIAALETKKTTKKTT